MCEQGQISGGDKAAASSFQNKVTVPPEPGYSRAGYPSSRVRVICPTQSVSRAGTLKLAEAIASGAKAGKGQVRNSSPSPSAAVRG